MKTAFLHISTQPYIYIFCFTTTLHTYPSDYQILNPNCVGFEGNAYTLEQRIGLKGEYARLAREAYFTFFPAFLFEGILAQFLL